MIPFDPMDILLAHNAWANQQMLNACAKLTEEQFHRRFEMGPGSLHDTVTHVIGAMRRWGDVLAVRADRPRIEGTRRSVSELMAMHEEAAADLAETAKKYPQDQIITATRGTRTISGPRSAILAHVATHGMHHRAQCLNMLRHVGVSPLPPSSILEWGLLRQ